MKIRQAFLQLKKFPDLMDLNPGLTKEEIQAFEEKNKLVLPDSYKNLLECFDGGEIFRPGTKIYGLGVGCNPEYFGLDVSNVYKLRIEHYGEYSAYLADAYLYK